MNFPQSDQSIRLVQFFPDQPYFSDQRAVFYLRANFYIINTMRREGCLIFGAGPAGLKAAIELRRKGVNGPDLTIIASSESPPYRPVYSTTIGPGGRLLAEYLSLMPADRVTFLDRIRVLAPGVDFTVSVPRQGSYFTIDYPSLVAALKREAQELEVSILEFPLTTLARLRIASGEVAINGSVFEPDLVVDATGVDAVLASRVEPERRGEDPWVAAVYFKTVSGFMTSPAMALIFGPAGGTSWLNPSFEPGCLDLVYSAWVRKSKMTEFLEEARCRWEELAHFCQQVPGIEVGGRVIRDGWGMIRSQPIPPPKSRLIYPLGEAAGLALPGSGDSLRLALLSAELFASSLRQGLTPEEFWRRVTAYHRYYLFFAMVLARLSFQEKGNLGGLVRILGQWLSSPTASPQLTRAIERYVIEGKLSPQLFARIMRQREFADYLLRVVARWLKVRLGLNSDHSNHYPLPPLRGA